MIFVDVNANPWIRQFGFASRTIEKEWISQAMIAFFRDCIPATPKAMKSFS